MAYLALYRQWRPQDFDNLVGQQHVSTTLKNAITAGKIAHAYLFAGPRGTGKTSTAKILAKALNCTDGPTPDPCNKCPNCERITNGTSMDVFEIDAASNRGIDEIRDLRETVKFAPVDGRYKVYIIDEVHMLTTEAFNALLKTLEEPPGHVVFILATTEPHKIPATIHSRCQRYDFRRIGVKEIEERLAYVAAQNGLQVEQAALKIIAVHADGGLRDALSILDQCTTLEGGLVTVELVRQLLGLIGHEWIWRLTSALAERDNTTILLTIDELISRGKDVRQIIIELIQHLRSLMLYKAAPDIDSIEMYSDERETLAAQSEKFSHAEIVEMIRVLQDAANEARWAVEPRITVEMALLSLCRRKDGSDVAALLERVAALEARLANQPVETIVIRREQQIERRAFTDATDHVSKQFIQQEAESPQTPDLTMKGAAAASAALEPVSMKVDDIWAAVLKELINNGKRSVHACVSQGQLINVTDEQATVQFTAPFPKERTEKEDYRTIIEKVLQHVIGKPVRLQCILGNAMQTPKVEEAPKPAPKPVDEEHPALKQALNMFGGRVIKQE